MPYKTIMLTLVQQSPRLHRELTRHKQLLSTVERTASTLKTRHRYWMSVLSQEQPESAPAQIASAALEIAVQEMQDALSEALPPNVPLPEPCSLDAAMAQLRLHTPPA